MRARRGPTLAKLTAAEEAEHVQPHGMREGRQAVRVVVVLPYVIG